MREIELKIARNTFYFPVAVTDRVFPATPVDLARGGKGCLALLLDLPPLRRFGQRPRRGRAQNALAPGWLWRLCEKSRLIVLSHRVQDPLLTSRLM